jgi:hypothetical protein
MTYLSKLRAELAETHMDVLAPQAAFMVKGGGSSKSKKKSKKNSKKNSKGGNNYGGGYGCGCGCGW